MSQIALFRIPVAGSFRGSWLTVFSKQMFHLVTAIRVE